MPLFLSGFLPHFFVWCFLLGIPFIHFGLDITQSKFNFFEKCLGMGFIASVCIVVFASLIGFVFYVGKNILEIWRKS